jgi:phosphopantothenoylcysteine decarboxylase/phosphopantothenate--cysteine ligase
MLFRKKIILGVTGSIAAYKSAALTRLLVKAGAEVRVLMTESARDFITPLTLHTLSKNPVHTSFTLGPQGEWVNHVELGLWADAMIIAPASANTLAQCANGLCPNLLSAVYLSARCPVFFAPAMDVDMWKHPATQQNIHQLTSNGNFIIEPGTGELASGLVGEGRMSEPEDIVAALQTHFAHYRLMHGKKILMTAGPTQEPIDAVRFISNHSSGKMGYALAEELALRGARVELVSGPVTVRTQHPNIHVIPVITADEMYEETVKRFAESDVAILTAAVADYQSETIAEGKMKKNAQNLNIQLKPTRDILASLGERKAAGQILAGFALETSDGRAQAEKKLQSKNLDFVVLNILSKENAVFGSDLNQIEIGTAGGNWKSFDQRTKTEAARDIADHLNELMLHA